jgi:hypothetical protein
LKTAIHRSGAKYQNWLAAKLNGNTAINPANKTGYAGGVLKSGIGWSGTPAACPGGACCRNK